jgi:hypothetical protein
VAGTPYRSELATVVEVMPIREPPIRVFPSNGAWRVDYGSYIDGFHTTLREAIATARAAATLESRELEIESTND